MDGWAYVQLAGYFVSGIAMIWAVRTRPGAPPGSWLIRWTVAGVLAGTAGLIAFGWWLATRHVPPYAGG